MKEVVISMDIIGLSTDTKPTDVPDGTIFYEVDTTDRYMLYSGIWYAM